MSFLAGCFSFPSKSGILQQKNEEGLSSRCINQYTEKAKRKRQQRLCLQKAHARKVSGEGGSSIVFKAPLWIQLSSKPSQTWTLTITLLGVGVKEQSTESSPAPGIPDFLPILPTSWRQGRTDAVYAVSWGWSFSAMAKAVLVEELLWLREHSSFFSTGLGQSTFSHGSELSGKCNPCSGISCDQNHKYKIAR